MHMEPEIVNGAKLALSYATAAAAFAGVAKHTLVHAKQQGVVSLLIKSSLTTVGVFCFFELLPHCPVGVSEVHLILGTSLLLMFGIAPAGIGLALGLLIQGLFFAPSDLPQYGMNVTTLLIPLFALDLIVRRIARPGQAYKDFSYSQVLRFSLTYQGGIVAWVAFWAFYGQGIDAETLAAVSTFGMAYLSVVLIEPVIDLGLLALAKRITGLRTSASARYWLEPGLFVAVRSSELRSE